MLELTGRARRVVIACACTVALSAPLAAHHGWSGYSDSDFQISGTVATPVSTSGPHATLRIRAAGGQVWNVVLAPGPRTIAAGLKEGIIPMGAEVTAFGHRHRDAKTFEIKTERLAWNGRTFNVYPNR